MERTALRGMHGVRPENEIFADFDFTDDVLSRATYFRPDAEQPWHLNFCRLESMDTSDRAT